MNDKMELINTFLTWILITFHMVNSENLKHVESNSSWTGPIAKTESPGNRIELSYSSVIPSSKCCPNMVVLVEPIPDYFQRVIKSDCINAVPGISGQLDILQNNVIPMLRQYYFSVGFNCRKNYMEDKRYYECSGRLTIELQLPSQVGVYAFYYCDKRQTISMKTEIRMWVKNQSMPCVPLPNKGLCTKYYTHAFLKYGRRENPYAVQYTEDVITETMESLPNNCHQDIEQFLCRTVTPECTHHGIIPPCRLMCQELINSPCQKMVTMLTDYLEQNSDDLLKRLFSSFCVKYPESMCFPNDMQYEISNNTRYETDYVEQVYKTELKIHNHTELESNSSWAGPIIQTEPPGNLITVDYKAVIPRNKCCPSLVVLAEPIPDDFQKVIKSDCICSVPNIPERLNVLQNNVLKMNSSYEGTQYSAYSHCRLQWHGQSSCSGKIILEFQAARQVGVYVFFPCNEKQTISMEISVHVTVDNQPIPCMQLPTTGMCRKYYTFGYVTYDARGNPGTFKASEELIRMTMQSLPDNCHEDIEEFLCRSVIPECTNHGSIPPCRSLCEEIVDSPCRQLVKLLATTLKDNTSDVFNSFCASYPDTMCFTKNIINKQAETENIDGVNATVLKVHKLGYSYPIMKKCFGAYRHVGDFRLFYDYSDRMTSITQCLAAPSRAIQSDLIITSSSFIAFVVLAVIASIFLIIYRQRIAVLCYSRFGFRFRKDEEEVRPHDAFISYSQEDIGFVKQVLVRPLERMNPPFKLCIHHRNFQLGDLISNNIIEAVESSKRVIVVLSQNYIDSEWCQFEFAQAHLQVVRKNAFRLIVITIEDPNTLRNVPKLIDSYIKTHTYLSRDDKLFWGRLLYKMPKPTEDTRLREVKQHEGPCHFPEDNAGDRVIDI